ncbi:MAG: hypothetical protein JO090_01595, partial [Rhizobacter sp.]|nr:hypothetical protein [Rhizobacter sp.]
MQDLFATRSAWLEELADVERSLPSVTRHRTRLGESGRTLFACLDARDALRTRLQRAFAYASLHAAEDGGDAARQADAGSAKATYARVEAEIKFVDAEIAALSADTVAAHLAAEPLLSAYRPVLDQLARTAPHLLSEETECVLESFGEVLGAPLTIYNRAKQGDFAFPSFVDGKGETHPNSFNLFETTYEASADAGVRRAAWSSFCQGLANHQHTLAATFATEVRKNVVSAKLRGHSTAEHLLLHDQQLPFDFYERWVATLRQELAPHMRRYARLRRRVLGLDRLLYCDIRAPLDATPAPALGFEEAGHLLLEALAPLGAEYVELVRTGLNGRWIDRANNAGKASGGFCATPPGVHSFVLMTWTGNMRDAFVLAHELGHAGNFMLAGRHQRLANVCPAMPFVEAPSLFNEVLLARHLQSQARDERTRRWVWMQELGTFHHNFVTHLLEAELQRRVYQRANAGESITAALLNALTRASLEEFWDGAVEIDDGAAMTWMRQPHYYLGLYPYTYSVGLVTALGVAAKAQAEGASVYARWLDVLR